MRNLLFLLIACGGARWTSVEDCEGLNSGPRQDECWAATLTELYRTDPARAEQITREKISDPQIRDYVYLTVTREVNPGSFKYCEAISEQALAERCRVLVSRPHLHRELTGGKPQPGGASAERRSPPQQAP